MGSIGRRTSINNIKKEPSLLGNVDDIVKILEEKKLIDGCIVDIQKLIEANGIEIKYDDTLTSNQSGYLRKYNEKWVIGVNDKHNRKRQRFTLAHEFAHYVLHRDDNDIFEDEIFFRDNNLTSIEFAANEYASKILMPESLVRENIIAGETDIEDLAEKFNVSVLAMKNRVLSLGYKLAI